MKFIVFYIPLLLNFVKAHDNGGAQQHVQLHPDSPLADINSLNVDTVINEPSLNSKKEYDQQKQSTAYQSLNTPLAANTIAQSYDQTNKEDIQGPKKKTAKEEAPWFKLSYQKRDKNMDPSGDCKLSNGEHNSCNKDRTFKGKPTTWEFKSEDSYPFNFNNSTSYMDYVYFIFSFLTSGTFFIMLFGVFLGLMLNYAYMKIQGYTYTKVNESAATSSNEPNDEFNSLSIAIYLFLLYYKPSTLLPLWFSMKPFSNSKPKTIPSNNAEKANDGNGTDKKESLLDTVKVVLMDVNTVIVVYFILVMFIN